MNAENGNGIALTGVLLRGARPLKTQGQGCGSDVNDRSLKDENERLVSGGFLAGLRQERQQAPDGAVLRVIIIIKLKELS